MKGEDRGISPLTLIFFVPVVFAAMTYPLGSVAAVDRGQHRLLRSIELAAAPAAGVRACPN
jgi:hypothetical protein